MKGRFCLPHLMTLLLSAFILSSCISEPTRSNRPIIEDLGKSAQEEEEIVEELTRPTGQVFLQSGFCACKAGKPAILGQCGTFCATKDANDQNTTLYLEAKLGEEILLNEQFGNLLNWCKSEIVSSDPDAVACANPACVFRIADSDGNEVDLNLAGLTSSNNKFQVVLDAQVSFDTTYVGKLVESQCSEATSDSIQFRRITGYDDLPDLDPLKIDPAIGYTCINRIGRVDDNTGTQFYDTGFKLHFYYVEHNEPPVISPSVTDIFCHDIVQYGSIQQANMNRLEMLPGIFNIWSAKDARFYDLGGDPLTGGTNSRKDIHDTIDTIMKQDGVTAGLTFDLFYELNWANFPSTGTGGDGDSSGTAGQSILGYIMAPFIDPDTDRSFCPKYADYTDPDKAAAIKAMKDVVGIDTEGLYLGVKQTEAVVLDGQIFTSPEDYIIIREGLLKQIWFYFENEQAIAPTSVNEGSKTLHFYWPPNTTSPYVKNSDQRLYTVRHPSEASSNGSSGSFAALALVPHDKKFACAPAAD